jgi:hypothetical protein
MSAFFAEAVICAGAAVVASKAAENTRQMERDAEDRRSPT